MTESFPELSIVLFNVDSSDKVTAADRQKCMGVILDTVLAENYSNLFVFSQDKINGPKHKILCEKLGQDPKSFRCISEAGIYHRHDPNGSYEINYVDVATLQRIDSKMGIEPNNPFTTARLMACILTPMAGQCGKKILLVSWHGPQKSTQKAACFRRLVRFSERLRRRDWCRHIGPSCLCCDIVIVGGDFNMSDVDAHKEMAALQKSDKVKGNVLGNYTTTDDRRGLMLRDYMVYWPKDALQDTEVAVLRRDFRRDKGERPFDHPIVVYRFGDLFQDVAKQLGNITLEDDEKEWWKKGGD